MAKKTAFGRESDYQTFALLGQKIGRNRDKKALKTQIDNLTGSDLIEYQRSASVLHHVCNAAPDLFLPYLDTLIKVIREHRHDSGTRVAMRTFMLITIPEKFAGTLIDLSFKLLNEPKITVAIKVYAMNIIATQAKIYPELIQELAISISNQISSQSPAFKTCTRKLSKKLKYDLAAH